MSSRIKVVGKGELPNNLLTVATVRRGRIQGLRASEPRNCHSESAEAETRSLDAN